MGRTLKRVPLDFTWPQGVTWEGYVNPHYKATECPHCEGGYSPDYTRLQAQWYSHLGGGFHPELRGSTPYLPDDELVKQIITDKNNRSPDAAQHYGTDGAAVRREAVRMCEIWNASWGHHLNEQDVAALVEANRLYDLTHIFTPGEGWKRKEPAYMPSPREVNDWSLQGSGHDSLNCHIVLKAELKRLNLPTACNKCDGSGEVWSSKEDKKTYDDWVESEPPTGDGYQLWETTSEGSPTSPVFATIEELCSWCETGATTFGRYRATAQQWREMLDADFVVHREGNALFL